MVHLEKSIKRRSNEPSKTKCTKLTEIAGESAEAAVLWICECQDDAHGER